MVVAPKVLVSDQVGPSGQVAFVDVADHAGARRSSLLLPFTSYAKSLNWSPAPSGPVPALAPVLGLAPASEALDHGARWHRQG